MYAKIGQDERGRMVFDLAPVFAVIGKAQLWTLSLVPPANKDEDVYYGELNARFAVATNGRDRSSRQIVVTDSRRCISFIQLHEDTLAATLRSSDTALLASDLGFLSRLALDYSCTALAVQFGSLHVVLRDKETPA